MSDSAPELVQQVLNAIGPIGCWIAVYLKLWLMETKAFLVGLVQLPARR